MRLPDFVKTNACIKVTRVRLALTASVAAVVIALVLPLSPAPVHAETLVVDIDDLNPGRSHKRATRLVTHYVSKYHYRRVPLDDNLSEQILDRYLDSLDSNRSYLSQQDATEFAKYEYRLDDALQESNVEAAFDIFRKYRKRVAERSDFAIKLLDSKFDYDIPESYTFDRTEQQWPDNAAALDDLWRKRVKNDILNLKLTGKDFDDIKKTLTARYQRLRTRTEQLNSDDVFQLFINAYGTAIEPHTSYFSPRTSENFKIRMSLSLEGIGAVLQSEDDFTLVRRIIPGGPADLGDQLHAGDRITGVGQSDQEAVDVVGWRLDDVVDLIRGPKGSEVTLQVLPKGSEPGSPSKSIPIVRDKIKLEEQAAQKSVIELPNDNADVTRVGVIKLPTFYIDFDAKARGDSNYRSTTRDVRKLIEELKDEGVDSLVIDLRSNGGGALTEATALTGLFIRSGPIVQVRDSQGRVTVNQDPDPDVVYTGPMAVLVDRNSASASEIFAGAIQDYQRGLILGERTYGKGTVQNLIDLDRQSRNEGEVLGQLKITMAQFFRINGGSTQHRGVIPDIEFPTAVDIEEHGERSLENALPWTSVAPANYAAFETGFDARAMRIARERHDSRIRNSAGFDFLVGRAIAAAKAEDRTDISLLESERKADREQRLKEDLERTNVYRESLGLKPLDSAEDYDEDDATAEDVVLREAAAILNDYSTAGKDAAVTDAQPKAADTGSNTSSSSKL